MLALQIFLLILGLALLVKGADWFVDGGAGIAKKCRISPLVIGLTIVAFGTSAPELAVSVTSAVQHSTDISIGNVVGSNIANILLILGVSALVHDLPVQKISLKLDFPVLLLASILLIGLGYWGKALSWYDGIVLLVVFSVYMYLLFRNAFREQKSLHPLSETLTALPGEPSKPESVLEEEVAEKEESGKAEVIMIEEKESAEKKGGAISRWMEKMQEKLWFLVILLVVGLAMVVGGGTLLVDAAREIAVAAGLSERVIGLTIVAVGTSLPELVTSVVAAFKGETDIAVGNIIGSNIFNIFIVAGVASLVYPLTFTQANLIDAVVALAAAALLYVLSLWKKHTLRKVGGAILLAGFIAYYVWLFVA